MSGWWRRRGSDRDDGDWLDRELENLAAQRQGDQSSGTDLVPEVLARIQREESAASVRPERALAATAAAVLFAMAVAFLAGVVWNRKQAIEISVENDRPLGAEGSHPAPVSAIGPVESPRFELWRREAAWLDSEVAALGRELAELRRLRDAAGPTLELQAQNSVEIVIPLREALDLAEAPAEQGGLRRVRW